MVTPPSAIGLHRRRMRPIPMHSNWRFSSTARTKRYEPARPKNAPHGLPITAYVSSTGEVLVGLAAAPSIQGDESTGDVTCTCNDRNKLDGPGRSRPQY